MIINCYESPTLQLQRLRALTIIIINDKTSFTVTSKEINKLLPDKNQIPVNKPLIDDVTQNRSDLLGSKTDDDYTLLKTQFLHNYHNEKTLK